MRTVNQNAGYQSRSVAIEERLLATVQQAAPEVRARLERYLAPQGISRVRIDGISAASNIVDGKAVFHVLATAPEGEVSMDLEVALDKGVPVLTEAKVLEEMAKVRAAAAADVDLGETDVPEMVVDFAKVSASRAGDLVLYTSPELPRWNLPVTAEVLKTEDGRKQVLAALVDSIGIYCLSDFGVQAALKSMDKGLPVVRAQEVKAAAVPKPLPELMAETLTLEASAQEAVLGGARSVKPTQSFSPQEFRAAEYRSGFESRIRRTVEPSLTAWAKAQGGGAIEVIGWDLSGAIDGTTGEAKGKVKATLRYYTDTAREEVEVEAALKADGTIDATTIAKSAEQQKFEAERTQDLNLKNEEEAKAELERFTAQQERQANTEALIRANLGIEAADATLGQNYLSKPAAKRIPILKALLPEGAMEAGKKVQFGGYVYVLAETDYGNNSGDPAHSAFLMACLTEEVPNDRIPGMGLWGGQGAVFGGRR
jgi:hypothetical protein